MYIKKRILKANSSKKIPIGLSISNDYLGFDNPRNQYDMNEYVNEIRDFEIVRFKYNGKSTDLLKFEFQKTTNEFVNNLTGIGFTNKDIEEGDITISNSFFIMKVYDSISDKRRNRVFSNYLTKITHSDVVKLESGSPTTHYKLNEYNQFQLLYIPKYYLPNSGIVEIYAEFYFFNANNKTNSPIVRFKDTKTGNNFIWKLNLDMDNKKWDFTDKTNNDVILYSTKIDSLFNKKINKTIDTKKVKTQVYPKNGIFDIGSGKYIDS